MGDKNDFFKLHHGVTFEEATRIPTSEEISDLMFEEFRSSYTVRELRGSQDSVFLREEERKSHMHIIGTTGEGKSKFLEWLIRGDIDNGNGLCFLDPSDRGDTMYKILAYCARVGYEKVLVLDPHKVASQGKIVPINPLYGPKEDAVAKTLDTFRVLYQQKDWSQTPVIRRYLKAILSVLWNAKMTISDTVYFSEPKFKSQRDFILQYSSEDDRQRAMIEYAFLNRPFFLEYQSTVRRLEEVFHPTLSLMYGSTNGIDFAKLIADKWVILINMYAGRGFEEIHTRLLGTTVINELISALDRLLDPKPKKDGTKKKPWKGVYYLYLDEAGRYANRNLADLLAYKRKSGLRVVIAHQYWKQFEDLYILEAVKELCKIKVAFYQPGHSDRLETVKHMFGGELSDRDVSYALSSLKQRNCVFKKPKKAPMVVRVPDTPDCKPASESYIKKLYSKDLYTTPGEVLKEQKTRVYEVTYATTRATHPPPKKTTKTARRPNSKDTAPRRAPNPSAEQSFAFDSLREDEITYPTDAEK